MKNERLEQLYKLYQLHTAYNNHENKPICICGAIISLNYSFKDLKELYETLDVEIQDFLEYLIKVNGEEKVSVHIDKIVKTLRLKRGTNF